MICFKPLRVSESCQTFYYECFYGSCDYSLLSREEAMRKAGTAHTKSSNDMENHVYVKAKSREEYLSLVARLIIHFRDIRTYLTFDLTRVSLTVFSALARCVFEALGPGSELQTGSILHHLFAHSSVGGPGQMPMQQMVQAQQQQQQQSIHFQQFQQQQQNVMQQQQNAAIQQQFQVQQQQLRVQQLQQQHHQNQQLQQQHQNQQQQQQAQNQQHSGPTPSPGGFQPSPSPQPSQSPATARTPQNYGVPSPGPLNTPGNPGSVMSPAGASSLEDQQYMEKLKQLSKYIEPLRRMINKIDKNEDRKKDLSKMKSLLNILTDPNTRCPLRTLQKCEIALEKLKNDMAVPTPPPPPVATKQQYLCQPLLDAVMANIRSPVFNHSLYRTFAPAMTAIHGPPITGPNVSGRKRKHEEDERQTIPNILQGEVARLDVKFLVNLDPSFCSNNGTVHLVCKLDDKNLPSVPPLQLSVPADYPEQSPHWADDSELYGANSFLQTVHRNMTSKLLQLPDKHSLTELLNTWAQSVRQACLSAA
uniref:Mediator of RNA polymerase II transcription subunit 15 n=1 Tax=Scophthalmus maximus TaxID=52904 RepID=A0A8D3DJT1_SCOMX